MRVSRFSPMRLHSEERGAVLAMVAISLICLLGMLVLTFDLGRGVAIKRNMVNAADSGALAAARECGLGRGVVSARGAAGELVTDNNGAAEVAGFQLAPGAQCGPGSTAAPNPKNEVTVTAAVQQEYFFAQIFGFNEGTVTASATAEWTFGLVNPAPLRLEALKVDECVKGGSGSKCYIAFQKDKNSQWGWLDFPEGWPEQGVDDNPMDCTSQKGGTSDLESYIKSMGMVDEPLLLASLWEPPPTYVCAEGGFVHDAQSAILDWIDDSLTMEIRPIVTFPVVACNGSSPPCYPWITGSRASYPVVRFEDFYFEHLWSGKKEIREAGVQDLCGFPRNFPSDVFCIELTVAGDDGNPPNTHPIVRLID